MKVKPILGLSSPNSTSLSKRWLVRPWSFRANTVHTVNTRDSRKADVPPPLFRTASEVTGNDDAAHRDDGWPSDRRRDTCRWCPTGKTVLLFSLSFNCIPFAQCCLSFVPSSGLVLYLFPLCGCLFISNLSVYLSIWQLHSFCFNYSSVYPCLHPFLMNDLNFFFYLWLFPSVYLFSLSVLQLHSLCFLYSSVCPFLMNDLNLFFSL